MGIPQPPPGSPYPQQPHPSPYASPYPQPQYQQPQQPQYPQPPYAPPPPPYQQPPVPAFPSAGGYWPGAPPRRRAGPGKVLGITLAILGTVVLLTAGIVSIVYFAGGLGRGPEDVVAEFVEAMDRGDCDRLVELVTESSLSADGYTREEARQECDDDEAAWFSATVEVRLLESRVVSDTGSTAQVDATVRTTSFEADETETDVWRFTLHKEDGEWRVHRID